MEAVCKMPCEELAAGLSMAANSHTRLLPAAFQLQQSPPDSQAAISLIDHALDSPHAIISHMQGWMRQDELRSYRPFQPQVPREHWPSRALQAGTVGAASLPARSPLHNTWSHTEIDAQREASSMQHQST